jgi:hypothetical protein
MVYGNDEALQMLNKDVLVLKDRGGGVRARPSQDAAGTRLRSLVQTLSRPCPEAWLRSFMGFRLHPL